MTLDIGSRRERLRAALVEWHEGDLSCIDPALCCLTGTKATDDLLDAIEAVLKDEKREVQR